MIAAVDMPVWLAALISTLVVLGALLTLLGCLGLLRFETFYKRIHAPTLGTSFGVIGVLLASAIYFSVTSERLVVHELLIFLFISGTTPITLTLLARAALYRDRVEGNDLDPAALRTPGVSAPSREPAEGDEAISAPTDRE